MAPHDDGGKPRGGFRDRDEDGESGLRTRELPPLSGTLEINTAVDLSRLDTFGASPVQAADFAAAAPPETGPGLAVAVDLDRVDEGVRKIKAQELDYKIRERIEEAQALIQQRKHRQAIRVLDRALKVDPQCVPVLFLQGYCYFALEEFDAALDLLDQARQHATDAEAIIQIVALHAFCSAAVTRQVEEELGKLAAAGDFQQALALIDGRLRRHPSNVRLTYHRCRLLMALDQVGAAKQAATAILPRLSGVAERRFLELLEEIAVQEHQRHLDAARTALRAGDPARALDRLTPCREVLAGQEQYEAVRAYAESLLPKRLFGSVFGKDKRVPLTEPGLQKVLLWLLDEELQEGVGALGEEAFDRAGATFGRAAKIDARCRIICFLHGVAIYRGFGKALEDKKPPALADAVRSLEQARSLVSGCAADPMVGDQSRNLAQAIDGYLSQLREVATENSRRAAEAKPINDLFKEFQTFGEELKRSPIGSLSDLDKAERRLKDMRQRAEKLRKRSGKEAAAPLADFVEAVNRNLEEAGKARSQFKQAKRSGSSAPDPSDPVAFCVQIVAGLKHHCDQNPYMGSSEKSKMREMLRTAHQAIDYARQRSDSAQRGILDTLEGMVNDMEREL